MNKEVSINGPPFSSDEITEIARLHQKSIDRGFISLLNIRFIEYLYRSLSECSESIVLICKDGEKVVGVISAATSLRSVYKYLFKKYPFGVIVSLMPSVFSPFKLARILEIVRYSKKPEMNDYPSTELLTLAVDVQYRQYGVGSQLYCELRSFLKANGVRSFKIVVGKDLKVAQKFYESKGAKRIDTVEVHKGATSFIYKMEV